jgi:hypothetical protein
MDHYAWPRLAPLAETLGAARILKTLPRVETRILVGWSLEMLGLVTAVLSIRPGTRIGIEAIDGHFRVDFAGGTLADSQSENHPILLLAFCGELAARTCEVCGRPALRRNEPRMVLCDSCLAFRVGEAPEFLPRLPLLDDAAEALRGLPAIESLPAIPAGWAPLVRSVLKRLGDGSGRDVTFRDRGGFLTVLVGGDPGGLESQVRTTLEALSRERCRFCGRHVEEDSPHPGECDGCRWVRSQGWEILPAFADDGGPS